MSSETKPAQHLWDIEHPYYCSPGSYWIGGDRWHEVHANYSSWADFLEDWDKSDLDMNLLFRWDWERANPEDYTYEVEDDPDFKLPGDTLKLFYFMQGKARNMSIEIAITESDEPAVREWLKIRAEHMRKLWEPLLDEVQS